jgi:hypothetical protein
MTKLQSLMTSVKDMIIPTEPKPDYEPVTAITSILKISPNMDSMEQLVESIFWEDPAAYLSR